VERLDASREDERRNSAERWEAWEARSAVRWGQIEALLEQLQQVADDQSARLGRVESGLERIDAIGADATALRREWESFRLEQDALRRDVLDRVERSRDDIEELRAGLESRGSSPSPLAPAPVDVRGPARAPRSPTARSNGGSARVSRRVECDLLARDLVRDRLAGHGERSAIEAPAIAATPWRGPGDAGPAASRLDAVEYQRLGALVDHCMQSGEFAEAAAAARHLVTYARDRIGESTPEHASTAAHLTNVIDVKP
jgi:hypothetical protein